MPRSRWRRGNIPKNRRRAYEALKARLGKTRAAKIANAGRSRAGRKKMARRAARTRKRR